jgi:hypothetical protein
MLTKNEARRIAANAVAEAGHLVPVSLKPL